MSFGSIIATGLTIILLIVACYVVMAGITDATNIAAAAAAGARDAKEAQLDTALSVANITRAGSGSLQVCVNNTGGRRISNVSQLDLIARFTAAQDCAPVMGAWLPWRASAGQDAGEHWHDITIISSTRDATGSQALDPGEMLVARCDFEGGLPSDAGSITVAAGNGASATALFNLALPG